MTVEDADAQPRGARPDADPAPPSLGRRMRAAVVADWLAPLAVQLAGLLFIAVRAGYPLSGWLKWQNWDRWDSRWYRSVALHGYFVKPSPPGRYRPTNLPLRDRFSGNVGWFPGYPTLSRTVADLTGLGIRNAMMCVAWVSWLLLLAGVWRLLAGARSPLVRWLALASAGFMTGAVYFAALFPIATVAAALVWTTYFVFRSPSRYAPAAALTALVAGFTYLTAIAAVPALVIAAVTVLTGARRRTALFAAGGALAGFLLVLLQMQLQAGMWNGYFRFTKRYQINPGDPVTTYIARIKPAWEGSRLPRGQFLEAAAWQSILGGALMALALGVVLVQLVRRPRHDAPRGLWLGPLSAWIVRRVEPMDLFVAVLAFGTWVMPFVAGGQASTYRSEAFLVLTVPLLRRLPVPVVLAVLALEVVVLWHMVPYFVNSQMI